FADGTPVDANAVAGWLTWYSKTNGAYGPAMGPNPQFTAVGQWKVRARLAVPVPNFFQLASDTGPYFGQVASPRCVADTTQFATGTCGAGPFKLDPAQTVAGDHYTYVPNPYYYDANSIKYGEVDLKVILVISSLVQALEAGQLDIVALGNDV